MYHVFKPNARGKIAKKEGYAVVVHSLCVAGEIEVS